MVMVKTDIEGVLAEAKTQLQKAKQKEFSKIIDLITRGSGAAVDFVKTADKYEKERLAHLSGCKVLKRTVREIYSGLDEMIGKSDNALLVKVMKKVRDDLK